MTYILKNLLTACDVENFSILATDIDVIALCDSAKRNKCASVCVNSAFVPLVTKQLIDSTVKTCALIGFPLGANDSGTKEAETRYAIDNGADEIDMTISVGKFLSGDKNYTLQDIARVVRVAEGKIVKVIIEAHYLTDEQQLDICELAKMAGAHFLRTSTGFSSGVATVSDVSLLKQAASPQLQVKASGGIQTARDAATMLEAGATRLTVNSLDDIISTFNDYK